MSPITDNQRFILYVVIKIESHSKQNKLSKTACFFCNKFDIFVVMVTEISVLL